MVKHLRYFLAPFLSFIAILAVLQGNYYPFIYIFAFDISIGLADLLLKEDKGNIKNPNSFILNLALYINLPLLLILTSLAIFVLTNYNPIWYMSLWSYFNINLFHWPFRTYFILVCKSILFKKTWFS